MKNKILGVKKIGIVGAGTIGASWATFYITKGFSINLQDINEGLLKKGYNRIRSNVEFLAQKKIINKNENVKLILSRINKMTTDVEEAVKDADFVQESAFENYETKKEIFKKMDSACSENVILASSSSGLLMTEIQKATSRPERCIIAHPFNPPHLIPLVEIVPGKQTSNKTISFAYEFYKRLGKVPVILKKEVPGYIANRLSAALWREAIDLVYNGVATVEDVDKALYAGPGLRYALMGPHMIYHLGGGEGGIEHFIEHLGPAFESWWRTMDNWTSIPYFAAKKVIEGTKDEMKGRTTEEIVRWRDDKLIELLKIIYGEKEE